MVCLCEVSLGATVDFLLVFVLAGALATAFGVIIPVFWPLLWGLESSPEVFLTILMLVVRAEVSLEALKF